MPKKGRGGNTFNLNVNSSAPTKEVLSSSKSASAGPDQATALAGIGRSLVSTALGAAIGTVSYRACRKAIPLNITTPASQIVGLTVAANAQCHIHKHLPSAENLAPLIREKTMFDKVESVSVIPKDASSMGPAGSLIIAPEEDNCSVLNPSEAYADLDGGLRMSNSLSPNYKKMFSQLKAEGSPKVSEVYNSTSEGVASLWEVFF